MPIKVRIWYRPHAAVYTDGSTDLLSLDELRELSLGSFADARRIPEEMAEQAAPVGCRCYVAPEPVALA